LVDFSFEQSKLLLDQLLSWNLNNFNEQVNRFVEISTGICFFIWIPFDFETAFLFQATLIHQLQFPGPAIAMSNLKRQLERLNPSL
jgi:hypothetical protein